MWLLSWQRLRASKSLLSVEHDGDKGDDPLSEWCRVERSATGGNPNDRWPLGASVQVSFDWTEHEGRPRAPLSD